MTDPLELLLAGGGGAGAGALLVGAVKWLGARSVNALDKTLEHLEKSIKEQGSEMKNLIGELTREMRALRDTDIRQAEQIGNLQADIKHLRERVDGQGAAWRAEIDRIAPRKLAQQ